MHDQLTFVITIKRHTAKFELGSTKFERNPAYAVSLLSEAVERKSCRAIAKAKKIIKNHDVTSMSVDQSAAHQSGAGAVFRDFRRFHRSKCGKKRKKLLQALTEM